MKRSKEMVENQFAIMKKMWEEGRSIKEMAEATGVGYCTVYNTFNLMGISLKKPTDESNLVYADNSVKLEKVTLYGRWQFRNGIKYRENTICTDVTQALVPR